MGEMNGDTWCKVLALSFSERYRVFSFVIEMVALVRLVPETSISGWRYDLKM
jgi:hypothetical protein